MDVGTLLHCQCAFFHIDDRIEVANLPSQVRAPLGDFPVRVDPFKGSFLVCSFVYIQNRVYMSEWDQGLEMQYLGPCQWMQENPADN
jgi:hypothetical protein